MHCADTSFLCALYRQQANSERAIATLEEIGAPIVISSLLDPGDSQNMMALGILAGCRFEFAP